MNESIVVVNVDDAINKLNQYKCVYGNQISVCIVDLTDGSHKKERKTIDEGCKIISKSKTLLFNGDDYVPHLMAFNLKSDDIFPKYGKLHDFLLSNKN